MDDVVLRQATAADSEFAYSVKRAAFGEYVEETWGWDEAEQRRVHERRFPSQDVRIISVADTDVGILACVVKPDCLYLNQLFILPEHQGRGIGSWCMLQVLEEARELGLPVRLRVLKANPRAIAFYEGHGITRTGETETHVMMAKE